MVALAAGAPEDALSDMYRIAAGGTRDGMLWVWQNGHLACSQHAAAIDG